MIKVSKRLSLIASFIEDSTFLVDCGCDHGKLAIYCLQNNKTIFAYLLDLRKNPLKQAFNNVLAHNLEKNTELILSNGLQNINKNFDTLVISGMGSELILNIIKKDLEKVEKCQKIILQSNKNMFLIRQEMNELGFIITNETVVFDEKYYEIVLFERKNEQNEMNYSEKDLLLGPFNVINKQKDFISYLKKEQNNIEKLLMYKKDNFLERKLQYIKDVLE